MRLRRQTVNEASIAHEHRSRLELKKPLQRHAARPNRALKTALTRADDSPIVPPARGDGTPVRPDETADHRAASAIFARQAPEDYRLIYVDAATTSPTSRDGQVGPHEAPTEGKDAKRFASQPWYEVRQCVARHSGVGAAHGCLSPTGCGRQAAQRASRNSQASNRSRKR